MAGQGLKRDRGRALRGLAWLPALLLLTVCASPRVQPRVQPRGQERAQERPRPAEPLQPVEEPVEEPATAGPKATPAAGAGELSPPSGATIAEPSEPVSREAVLEPARQVMLRIGLASDLDRVTLPCCDASVWADVGGETLTAVSPFTVEPAAPLARQGVFRVQVAALKDEGQARTLAARLSRDTGAAADSVFDARTDLYRVRVGRFAGRPEAESLQRQLSFFGVDSSWIVSEGGGVGDGGFLVTQKGRTRQAPGRWLEVQAGAGGIRVEGRRYRGRLLVFINNRGTLNLINEVELEEYLRGVVPREMGPKVFDQIEALKAQAVAARSYAIRVLGEFADEGYDLCSTPRCQVYGGMEDEDALSDRAIRETAGKILMADGEVADALYSSTCGGHTEDVGIVFPLKTAPYLRGVPCIEAGTIRLGGPDAPGVRFPGALIDRLLGDVKGASFAARVGRLAGLAGLSSIEAAAPPAGDLRRAFAFLIATLALEDDVELFVSAEDLNYYFPEAPPAWSRDDLRRAALFVKLGWWNSPLDAVIDRSGEDTLVLRAAVHLGVVEEQAGNFRSLHDGRIEIATREETKSWPLAARAEVFRLSGGAAVAQAVELIPGDRVRLTLAAGEVVAVVQEMNAEGASFDRTSNRRSWTRRVSLAELTVAVRSRYPGFELRDFEILERGRSGRVAKIRLLGSGSQGPVIVQGLAVRWTLGLPDTWFSVRRLRDAKGAPIWLFQGRGWGHGVGMCQVGSYGMAVRGRTYEEILRHYYTGVSVVPVEAIVDRLPLARFAR
jgi:stage II sporulation protein D